MTVRGFQKGLALRAEACGFFDAWHIDWHQ